VRALPLGGAALHVLRKTVFEHLFAAHFARDRARAARKRSRRPLLAAAAALPLLVGGADGNRHDGGRACVCVVVSLVDFCCF
jgi:hypothetical protein